MGLDAKCVAAKKAPRPELKIINQCYLKFLVIYLMGHPLKLKYPTHAKLAD